MGNKETDLTKLMKGANRSQAVERTGTPKTAQKNTGVRMLKNTETSDEPLLNVAIPQTLHRALKVYAVQTDQQMREVVEKAVTEYLERQR
jgi:hypothetical protein